MALTPAIALDGAAYLTDTWNDREGRTQTLKYVEMGRFLGGALGAAGVGGAGR